MHNQGVSIANVEVVRFGMKIKELMKNKGGKDESKMTTIQT